MELFAFVYGPGPMISCEGGAVTGDNNTDAPGQIMQMVKPVPSVPNPHPVVPMIPRVLELSALMNICCADEVKPVVSANSEDNEKSTSLTSWPTLLGSASRSLRVTVRSPLVVTNMADALTLPPATVAPDAVKNVTVAPEAKGLAIKRQKEREANLHDVRCIAVPRPTTYNRPVRYLDR